MSINIFNSDENKALIWDMLLTNNIFNNVSNDNFANVKNMFENIISRIGENITTEISREELLRLNKIAILEIKNNIDIIRQKNNQNTVNNHKVLIFDRNLEAAKNNFNNSITIKKPSEPEFSDGNDEPINNDNMNDMLEKLQNEREALIHNTSNNTANNDQTNLPNNKLNSTNIYVDTDINSNDNSLRKISNIEELLTIKKDKHVRFNTNISTILQQEYKSEEQTNKNIKLNSIYNLLKEIENNQKTILSLLNNI